MCLHTYFRPRYDKCSSSRRLNNLVISFALQGGKLPALAVNSAINISKLSLLGKRQPLISASDQDLSFQSLGVKHSHLYHHYSPPPVLEDPGPGYAVDSESTSVESSTPRVRTTFNGQIVPDVAWPTELCTRTQTGSPLRPLLAFNLPTFDDFPANDPMWPLGGVYTSTQASHRLGADAPSNHVHSSAGLYQFISMNLSIYLHNIYMLTYVHTHIHIY